MPPSRFFDSEAFFVTAVQFWSTLEIPMNKRLTIVGSAKLSDEEVFSVESPRPNFQVSVSNSIKLLGIHWFSLLT
jgi:hypothetical protein